MGGDRGEGGLGLPRHRGEGALTSRSLAVTGAAWRAFVGAATVGPTLPPLLQRSPPPTSPHALVNHDQVSLGFRPCGTLQVIAWRHYYCGKGTLYPSWCTLGGWVGQNCSASLAAPPRLANASKWQNSLRLYLWRTKFRFDNWLNATVQARTFDCD